MSFKKLEYSKIKTCLNQRIPVNDFMNLKSHNLSPSIISYENQQKIYELLEEIITLNPYYVKLFLKQYITLIESSEDEVEILEELYELYCSEEILNAIESDPYSNDILKYSIGRNTISIKETPKIISGNGTTGLRTWEAALYLSHYLNSSRCAINFDDKKICELGTGTGLVSLSLLKNQGNLGEVIFTDGDSSLIENLNDTFKLNNINQSNTIKTQQLLWGTTNPLNEETFIQNVPDSEIVIAADVTYDSSILPQLCSTLFDFLKNGTELILIAATIRNELTIKDWEIKLDRWFGKLGWEILEECNEPNVVNEEIWFKSGTPPIKLYKIFASSSNI